jgi:hypothetical protein
MGELLLVTSRDRRWKLTQQQLLQHREASLQQPNRFRLLLHLLVFLLQLVQQQSLRRLWNSHQGNPCILNHSE